MDTEEHRYRRKEKRKQRKKDRKPRDGYSRSEYGREDYDDSISPQLHRYYEEQDRSASHDRNNLNAQPYSSFDMELDDRQHAQEVDREDEYNVALMRQRETEIFEINKKMHTVNEIYKDLAEIIEDQQDLIDQVDDKIELAKADATMGRENLTEARRYAEHSFTDDPFFEKGSKKVKKKKKNLSPTSNQSSKRSNKSSRRPSGQRPSYTKGLESDNPLWVSLQDEMKDMVNGIQTLGTSLVKSCTAPEPYDTSNEYVYR